MEQSTHSNQHPKFQCEELYEKLVKCILDYDEYYYDGGKEFRKQLVQEYGDKRFKKLFNHLAARNSLFIEKCSIADYLKMNEFMDKVLSETRNQ